MFYNIPLKWALHAVLAFGFMAAYYVAMLHPEAFPYRFAVEDGPIEYLTAILIFCAALILLALSGKVSGRKRILLIVYALVFTLAAGEEVSWGQRIFDIESSEFFLENNFQGETNFHNLVVGDAHLAEFVFGTGLSILIMLYLLLLPALYPRAAWVRSFCELLSVPVPPGYIGFLAVLASVFCAWIDLDRQWEIYEFAFSVFVCLIFLNPANPKTFNLSQ
ncbi:MAG: hypothetical protein AB8B71_06975 [Paracoccaceae bacterium]